MNVYDFEMSQALVGHVAVDTVRVRRQKILFQGSSAFIFSVHHVVDFVELVFNLALIYSL